MAAGWRALRLPDYPASSCRVSIAPTPLEKGGAEPTFSFFATKEERSQRIRLPRALRGPVCGGRSDLRWSVTTLGSNRRITWTKDTSRALIRSV